MPTLLRDRDSSGAVIGNAAETTTQHWLEKGNGAANGNGHEHDQASSQKNGHEENQVDMLMHGLGFHAGNHSGSPPNSKPDSDLGFLADSISETTPGITAKWSLGFLPDGTQATETDESLEFLPGELFLFDEPYIRPPPVPERRPATQEPDERGLELQRILGPIDKLQSKAGPALRWGFTDTAGLISLWGFDKAPRLFSGSTKSTDTTTTPIATQDHPPLSAETNPVINGISDTKLFRDDENTMGAGPGAGKE